MQQNASLHRYLNVCQSLVRYHLKNYKTGKYRCNDRLESCHKCQNLQANFCPRIQALMDIWKLIDIKIFSENTHYM